jgi:hypothetical protein
MHGCVVPPHIFSSVDNPRLAPTIYLVIRTNIVGKVPETLKGCLT